MAGAISRGLSLNDFKVMTLGQIVDYCITHNEINQKKEPEEETVREATELDFATF